VAEGDVERDVEVGERADLVGDGELGRNLPGDRFRHVTGPARGGGAVEPAVAVLIQVNGPPGQRRLARVAHAVGVEVVELDAGDGPAAEGAERRRRAARLSGRERDGPRSGG